MKKVAILLIALMVISMCFLSGCTEQTALQSNKDQFEINKAAQYDGLIVQVTDVGRDESYLRVDDNGEFVTEEAGEGWDYVSVYYTIWNDDRIYVNVGRLDFVIHDSEGNKYYSGSFDGIINYDSLNRVNMLYKGESGYDAQYFLIPDNAVGLKVYYNLGTISSPNWVYWLLNVDSSQSLEEDEEDEEIFDTSSHLSIIDSNGFIDSVDWTKIFGIVKNIGSTNLKYVELSCTLYDASGNVIANKEGYMNKNILEPDDTSSFNFIFEEDYYHSYDIEIIDASEVDCSDTIGSGLSITNHYREDTDYSVIFIKGEIENTGTETADSVCVYARLYDSNGKIIGVQYGSGTGDGELIGDLYSGWSDDFKITIFDDYYVPDSTIASYELVASHRTFFYC
jgi:hypothetical protein